MKKKRRKKTKGKEGLGNGTRKGEGDVKRREGRRRKRT